MSGTGPRGSHQGVNGSPGEAILVDLENPDEVRAQVWGEEVLAGGVEYSLMGVRRILTRCVWTRLCHLKGLVLDRLQCRRVSYGEGAEARTGTVYAVRLLTFVPKWMLI
jgi:hypothetical protein